MINAAITGISIALNVAFGDGYEIHCEEIKQDMKVPCFFISPLNPSIRGYPGKRYRRENRFMIQYFPESEYDANMECMDTAEKMFWCLEQIKIGNKPIRGYNMNYEIVDGILNFTVDYNFFVHKTENMERMHRMRSDTRAKG